MQNVTAAVHYWNYVSRRVSRSPGCNSKKVESEEVCIKGTSGKDLPIVREETKLTHITEVVTTFQHVRLETIATLHDRICTRIPKNIIRT